MPINTDPHFVGRASISPDGPVVAGHVGTWTITYEVGAYGYDEFARLKIACRFASDWGTPQFTDPAALNYATVRLESRNPAAVARLAYEPRGHVRPWFKCLVVSIRDGSLYPGDQIHVTMGDTSGGGPGSRAQTFREKGCEWRLLVDPFGTELYSVLVPSPKIDVVGGELHRLVVVAPTTVRAGEPFDALVKAEDVWGNPCERFEGNVRLGANGAHLTACPRRSRSAPVKSPSRVFAICASPVPRARRTPPRRSMRIARSRTSSARSLPARRRPGGATCTARRARRSAPERSRSISSSGATWRCST